MEKISTAQSAKRSMQPSPPTLTEQSGLLASNAVDALTENVPLSSKMEMNPTGLGCVQTAQEEEDPKCKICSVKGCILTTPSGSPETWLCSKCHGYLRYFSIWKDKSEFRDAYSTQQIEMFNELNKRWEEFYRNLFY
jgi:hypothetical protein